MPWVEELSDPRELRRCIRDLVALSTLPAIWTGYGPKEIADSVATALVSMLEADFVYIALPVNGEEPTLEVAHSARSTQTEPRMPLVGQSPLSGSGARVSPRLSPIRWARAAHEL